MGVPDPEYGSQSHGEQAEDEEEGLVGGHRYYPGCLTGRRADSGNGRRERISGQAEVGSTLAANENSQNHFYQASQDQRDALRADLGRDDLSWAQREALHDRLDQNVRQVSEKDSESKQFLGAGMKMVAAAGAAALGLGVVFVGGKLAGASDDGSEESQ